MEPNRLDTTFRQTLYRHTAGHPLFTLELLRDCKSMAIWCKTMPVNGLRDPTLNWDRLPARGGSRHR